MNLLKGKNLKKILLVNRFEVCELLWKRMYLGRACFAIRFSQRCSSITQFCFRYEKAWVQTDLINMSCALGKTCSRLFLLQPTTAKQAEFRANCKPRCRNFGNRAFLNRVILNTMFYKRNTVFDTHTHFDQKT